MSAKLRAASTCTFPATMPGCQEIIVPPPLPAVAVKCAPTLPFWCDPTTSSVPPVVGPSHALCCVLQPAGHTQTAVPGSCAAAAAPKLRTIPRLGPAAQARPGARRRGLRAGRHARRLPKRRSSEEVPSAGTVAQAEHALRCQVRANKLTRTLLGAPAAACPSRCRPCAACACRWAVAGTWCKPPGEPTQHHARARAEPHGCPPTCPAHHRMRHTGACGPWRRMCMAGSLLNQHVYPFYMQLLGCIRAIAGPP